MAATTIDIKELPGRFQEIVSLAMTGAEVIVTEGNVPRARLVPLPPGGARVPGLHAGAIKTADDFDAPLLDDRPVAEIKPEAAPARQPRPFGLCAGQFTVSDDFDRPLPEAILNELEGR